MADYKRTVFAIGAWVCALVYGLAVGTVDGSLEPLTTTMRTEVANTRPTSTTTSTIPPTTTTAYVAVISKSAKRCPQYEPLFRDYGLEPVRVFSYIAWRESRCQPEALNTTLNADGSFDSGLLQINSTWRTVTRNICGGGMEMLLAVDCNLRVAKYLLDNGGLGHWGVDE